MRWELSCTRRSRLSKPIVLQARPENYGWTACRICGKPFAKKVPNHRYHSPECAKIGYEKAPSKRSHASHRPPEYKIRPLHGPKAHPYCQASEWVERQLIRRIVPRNLYDRAAQLFCTLPHWRPLFAKMLAFMASERRKGRHEGKCRCTLCWLRRKPVRS